MNSVYFDGEIGGFQFYLQGITVEGASGGTAEEIFDDVQVNPTSGKVLGITFTGAVIPAGSDVLTTISFSNAEDEICFAPNDCTSGACTNVISNADGESASTD